jgi:hypothetical protein
VSPRAKAARAILLLLGFGFLGGAVWATWDTFVEALVFEAAAFGIASGLCLLGLILLGGAWAVLHPPGAPRVSLVFRFLLAQPGKYVPGGVAMPAGQVALSREHDHSTGSSLVRLVIHSGLMVAGAAVVAAAGVVVGPRRWLGGTAAVVAVGVAAGLLILDLERVAGWVIGAIKRITRRGDPGTTIRLDITRPTLLGALALTTMGMAAISGAFPVVAAAGVGEGVGGLGTAAAFAVAWAVGFVLVPLPAGAGAREAVLGYALVGSAFGAIIATSVVHRAAMLVAESIGALAAVIAARSNMRSPSS